LKAQASPFCKGEGRRLRWARNVVKRYTHGEFVSKSEMERQRFERASALILADKLRNS